jgi:hypothetical protein
MAALSAIDTVIVDPIALTRTIEKAKFPVTAFMEFETVESNQSVDGLHQ